MMCFIMLFVIVLPHPSISKRGLSIEELQDQLLLQKNPKKRIDLLLKIGGNFGEPQIDSCLHYYTQALDAAKEYNKPLTISNVLHTIGMFHHRRGEFKQSKIYFLENVTLADENLETPQIGANAYMDMACLLYTSPSPRDATLSRMPSSA